MFNCELEMQDFPKPYYRHHTAHHRNVGKYRHVTVTSLIVTAALSACPLVSVYSLWVQILIFTVIFLFLLTFINVEHQSRVTCSIRAGSSKKLF